MNVFEAKYATDSNGNVRENIQLNCAGANSALGVLVVFVPQLPKDD